MFYPKNPQNQAQSPTGFAEFQLRERFLEKFPHSWDFLEKESLDAPWKTVKKYRLTEQKLWYKYTDPNLVLGVRFGSMTNYALFDVDFFSPHHPEFQEESLQKLTWELTNWGIDSTFNIRSSPSGGFHVYFFLTRPVHTFYLACVLANAAFNVGIPLKNGHLEAFPNTKAYNSLFQGHRLPLQAGSYLLDDDHLPYSDRLEDFLDAADESAAANDVELLESRLDEAYRWYKQYKRQQRYPAPTPDNKDIAQQIDYCQREIEEGFLYKIRIAVEQGFDDFSQTNDLLLTIGKLGRLAYGLSGNNLADYIRETAVSCKGYLQYCRHKHEIHRRSSEVARWAERNWYPYGTSRQDRNVVPYRQIKESLTNRTNLNDEKKHNAQSRIIQAIAYLEQKLGELPRLVGERMQLLRTITKELFGLAISDVTLKKPHNLALWHPKHRQENQDAELISEASEQQSPVEPSIEQKSLSETPSEPISSVEDEPPVALPILQPEQPSNKPCENRATLPPVIRKSSENAGLSQSSPTQDSKDSGYTPSIMKGIMAAFSKKAYRYFGAVQIATVWKPGARIEFESLQPKEIIQILELRDSQKNETKILQEAVYAMVKPKNSDWESGIQIQLSQLQAYDLPFE